MFNVILGKEGLVNSYQAAFPETTECVHCKAESRIGFVAQEGHIPYEDKDLGVYHVCDIHPNDPKNDDNKEGKGYWLHDCCAVAVYFCKGCLDTTALYNQG